jgi:hypothetical protein
VEDMGTAGHPEEPLETDKAPSPVTPAPAPEPESDAATAVRLVVGVSSLGLEAFTSRLRSWRHSRPSDEIVPTLTSPSESGSVTDAMVGVAARGARAAISLGARGMALAERGLRTAEGATEAVGRAVPGFVAGPVSRARDRAADRMRKLGATGREELERSRDVARAAMDDGLDAVVGRLADNRELRFVIRAQSVSAAEEAVDGLRGETAKIDDRLEGAARRLFRKRARPPTPTSS